MTRNEVMQKIKIDEFDGEKLICKFRVVIAIIFLLSVPFICLMKVLNGESAFPIHAYFCCVIFLIYSIGVHFYLKNRNSVPHLYKYICVIIDVIIHSASIWIGCTYPDVAPAITYLSNWALFFLVLIMLGAFRYSVPCAYFSGIFAALCYLLVVVINAKNLDLPYYFIIDDRRINVSFPVFYEFFRVIAIIITGFITGMGCKRHLNLFISMIESQRTTVVSASETVDKTRTVSKTIQKSTDEIFLSSKQIFSTANNQAASIQEIEATINENTQLAVDIAVKTISVAKIASKMKNDVIHGFAVLERNITQLENIKMKNDGVITGIISLGNKIIKIRDILKNINIITDQTKVIAFNAALEAASAGENGKRFAVVASEVNRLADDITLLTKEIREHVEEIQGSSSSLILSSEESADKILEGNNLIKELEEIFRKIKSGAEITANQAQTISGSTQMQLESTEQITSSISDISVGLSNFIQSTRIATSSAEELTKMTAELGDILTTKDKPDIKQDVING